MEQALSIKEEVERVQRTMRKVTLSKARKLSGGRKLRLIFEDGLIADLDVTDIRGLAEQNGLR